MSHPVIAVDGPAASGKGTLARRLAKHYGFHHLDTGLIYRAVGWQVRDVLEDVAAMTPAAIAAAGAFDPDWTQDPVLKSEAAGRAASIVSAIPQVREALIRFQHHFAGLLPGAVLDGRDIGTVICPQAPAKLFVTAAVEIRASRRHKELQSNGVNSIYAAVLQDLIDRDARDSARVTAPLKVAEDAVVLDTTDLDIEAAYRAALDIVSPRITAAGPQ